MTEEKEMYVRLKKVLQTLFLITLFLLAIMWIATAVIYNSELNTRFDSFEPTQCYVEDYDGLERTRFTFPSNHGQLLTGYMYQAGDKQKGIVIVSHSLEEGHNPFMPYINFFAQNGFYVFGFDVTGTGESEGKGINGLPQGVIDLDHAITFVEENPQFPDLPIFLFGHSWGGYSVCSVLTYHPEIRAVIAVSGFNSSSEMISLAAQSFAGKVAKEVKPFVWLHESLHFGNYAWNTAEKGFKRSDATVLIVHGKNDTMIPVEASFDRYYENHKDDTRFSFILLEERKHGDVFLSDNGKKQTSEFRAGYQLWLDSLTYDYEAKDNAARFEADEIQYFHENLNREILSDYDENLFQTFLRFYCDHLG